MKGAGYTGKVSIQQTSDSPTRLITDCQEEWTSTGVSLMTLITSLSFRFQADNHLGLYELHIFISTNLLFYSKSKTCNYSFMHKDGFCCDISQQIKIT